LIQSGEVENIKSLQADRQTGDGQRVIRKYICAFKLR
jgi:hypothetical protein